MRDRTALGVSGAISSTLTAAVVAIFASLAGACSSSGGADTQGDAGTGSVVVSALCQKLGEYDQQCGQQTPCDQARVAACPQFYSNFSPAYLAGYDRCLVQPFACGDGGLGGNDLACQNAALAALHADAAQLQLKADMCRACPDGASTTFPQSCSSFFTSPDGGEPLGAVVLAANDAVVQKMDQGCIVTNTGDCAEVFTICAVLLLATSTPAPAACLADGG